MKRERWYNCGWLNKRLAVEADWSLFNGRKLCWPTAKYTRRKHFVSSKSFEPSEALGQIWPMAATRRGLSRGSLKQMVESLTKSKMESSGQLGELRAELEECEECSKQCQEQLKHLMTPLGAEQWTVHEFECFATWQFRAPLHFPVQAASLRQNRIIQRWHRHLLHL